jgi:hypothetical protein
MFIIFFSYQTVSYEIYSFVYDLSLGYASTLLQEVTSLSETSVTFTISVPFFPYSRREETTRQT